jgi:hypothetical protein
VGSVEPSPGTDLFPSWYQPKSNTSNQTQTTDKVSNKLATSCTPELAKQTQGGNAVANIFSVDIYYGNSGATTTNGGTDDVHNCSDTPPGINLTVKDSGGTSAINTCTGSCTITAAVTAGTHPLDDSQYAQFPGTVNFSVNGQVVKTIPTASGGPYSFTYNVTTAGEATVSAQVIDSVLYSSTDSSTVTMTLGPGGGHGNGNGGGPNTFNNHGNNSVTNVVNTHGRKKIPIVSG